MNCREGWEVKSTPTVFSTFNQITYWGGCQPYDLHNDFGQTPTVENPTRPRLIFHNSDTRTKFGLFTFTCGGGAPTAKRDLYIGCHRTVSLTDAGSTGDVLVRIGHGRGSLHRQEVTEPVRRKPCDEINQTKQNVSRETAKQVYHHTLCNKRQKAQLSL